jgi:uncharacterized membrane protein YczE
VILALGLTLNTKAGLGVSPIISVPYCVSNILQTNFANMTLWWYCIFVVVEMALHLMKKCKRQILLGDLLQIPLSVVFTRFMNVFSVRIPSFAVDCEGMFVGTLPGRILVLALAILLTGVGAAMSLNMRIVPNPGDGIVQTIADFTGKSVGFTKNCFDLCNVLLTTCVGLLFTQRIIGIGLGTVLAVVGVGRVIALFNHMTKKGLLRAAGME